MKGQIVEAWYGEVETSRAPRYGTTTERWTIVRIEYPRPLYPDYPLEYVVRKRHHPCEEYQTLEEHMAWGQSFPDQPPTFEIEKTQHGSAPVNVALKVCFHHGCWVFQNPKKLSLKDLPIRAEDKPDPDEEE